MIPAYLAALARPIAVCLLAGLLRFLTDYQQTGKALPSLVDGAVVAAYAAGGLLGVNGAAAGASTVRAKTTAALKPTT